MEAISKGTANLEGGSGRVLESITTVSELTDRVRGKYRTVTETTEQIRQAMERLEAVSAEVTDGIGEIDAGTHEIVSSMNDVSRISTESSENVRRLAHLIETFRTGDGEAT